MANLYGQQIEYGCTSARNAVAPIIANRAYGLSYPKSWVGIFALNDDGLYWLLSVAANTIEPTGDLVGDENAIRDALAVILDARSNPTPPELLVAPDAFTAGATQGANLTLEELFGESQPTDSQYALNDLHANARTRQTILIAVAVVGVGGMIAYEISQRYTLQRAKDEAANAAAALPGKAIAAAQAIIQPRVEPMTLSVPSIAQPRAIDTLKRCIESQYKLPTNPGGWSITSSMCDADTIRVQYTRGGRGLPVNEYMTVMPDATPNETGTAATLLYQLPPLLARDNEALLPIETLRVALLGKAQATNEQLTLTNWPTQSATYVSIDDVPAELLYKAAVTIAPFRPMTYTLASSKHPARFEAMLNLPGLTIKTIRTDYAQDPTGRVFRNYVITGDIYGL
ncbi:MAG: type 4b pilus protein PilO2 [Betaproteobacteria bacterium]|nr:type 4b pilus protein PilO2 [Betaproteobacteria bacterium]